MIIKVKSSEWKPESFNELLISNKKGKYVFRIESKILNDFILYLYENGIKKFKVELEEEDVTEIEEKRNLRKLSNKPTQIEYYECILSSEIPTLEKNKDIEEFFNLINFVDNEGIFKALYDKICKITQEEYNEWRVHKSSFYFNIFRSLYWENDKFTSEAKRIEEVMRGSLRTWIMTYHLDFSKYFKNWNYIEFLKFLLKHTDKKYI